MKPGMSAARTGFLPRLRAMSVAACTTRNDVRAPATTSTRGMAGAGLKKCIPTTLSGRAAAEAMEVIEREEVFEANMVSGALNLLRDAKISCLSDRSSGAASMTTGHEA